MYAYYIDMFKIYSKAHGSKPPGLVINFDKDDEYLLKDADRVLIDYGIGIYLFLCV